MLQAQPAEHACVAALRRRYLTSVPAVLYRLPGTLGDLTSADWWAGLPRLQPGSASGSQAQESWHRHKLKKHISAMHQHLPAFFASLSSFTQSRDRQLLICGGSLPDIPVEPFPDPQVLHDSRDLTVSGRSSAEQYHRTTAFDTYCDQDGNFWYAMRCTLATYNKSPGRWSFTPDTSVRRPAPGLAEQLRCIFMAKQIPGLLAALQAGGCAAADPAQVDLEPLRRLLSKRVLVVQGPGAATSWSLQTEVGPAPSYRQAVCLNCSAFALHGACEHVHVAFLQHGHIPMGVAVVPHPDISAAKNQWCPPFFSQPPNACVPAVLNRIPNHPLVLKRSCLGLVWRRCGLFLRRSKWMLACLLLGICLR